MMRMDKRGKGGIGADQARVALLLAALALLAACSAADDGAKDVIANEPQDAALPAQDDGRAQHLDTVPLIVRHRNGDAETALKVEIALTQAQQEKGLMHRTALNRGEGMLFPILPPRNVSFWMKGTRIPLDLLFIQPDGRIARVAARAKPGDLSPIFADVPVAAVLELRGGDALALGIEEGDRVRWGACAHRKGVPVAQAENFCPAG
ncbi:MAG: DUF192 domain-containing protein [Sphingobium sp.]